LEDGGKIGARACGHSCSTALMARGGPSATSHRIGAVTTRAQRRTTAGGATTSSLPALPRRELDPPLAGRPDDLLEVVADLARRTRERGAAIPQRPTALDAADTAARLPAAQIAWALRGLFNGPEATTLLRVGKPPFSATPAAMNTALNDAVARSPAPKASVSGAFTTRRPF